MKRNYKIFAMLLLIINIITCFIPGYFYVQVWEYDWLGSTQIAKFGGTMFDVTTDDVAYSGPAYTFARFVVVCWVVCIGMIFFSIIRNKDHKLIGYAPCICLVPFFAYIRYVNSAIYDWSTGYTNYSVNWLFYISLALQISAAALMVIAVYAKDDHGFRAYPGKYCEKERP